MDHHRARQGDAWPCRGSTAARPGHQHTGTGLAEPWGPGDQPLTHLINCWLQSSELFQEHQVPVAVPRLTPQPQVGRAEAKPPARCSTAGALLPRWLLRDEGTAHPHLCCAAQPCLIWADGDCFKKKITFSRFAVQEMNQNAVGLYRGTSIYSLTTCIVH